MNKDKIFVTQPSLPPLEEFSEYLEKIWQSKILTNNGPFHQQFEKELAEYLGVKYLSLFSNGTLALITALQSLKITGEVITTPFSFVATTHALWWNNIKPVFVDIEPDYLTLDSGKIEAAITSQTTAILPVHVYGNPCKMEAIQKVADKYNLKIIYDAAHAFGIRVSGNSILNYGDLSILSFHATKVFNTIEGGAIICHDENTKKRVDYLKNFGFTGETTITEPGINAKMNELQAAFGLLQLKHHSENISKRRGISELYRDQLKNVKGISLLHEPENNEANYSYFPVFVDGMKYGMSRDELYEKLKNNGIFGRRYFYPLISSFSNYNKLPSAIPQNLPVATKVADQVICLPIYSGLKDDIVIKISRIIKESK